jgi:hypothetical protein
MMAAATKNPTKRNDTPNTPGVNESEIAAMKVDDLRKRLSRRGVTGTADLKKPELVKKLVKALVAENRAGSTKRTPTAGKTLASSASAKKSAQAKSAQTKSAPAKSSSRNSTGRNATPNTPAVDESVIARLKVGELRRRLDEHGVKGTAELKKPDLVKKLIKASVAGAKASSTKASARKTAAMKSGPSKSGPSKSAASKSAASKSAASKSAKKR